MNAGPTGTRGLVAPELLTALDGFPDLKMSDEFIAFLRSDAGRLGCTRHWYTESPY